MKRPTALGLAFEGRSKQFHTMPKKGNFLPDSKAKKGKNDKQQFTAVFFSCSVRKKADIVVFVQDIFLHDLQFSHSLGLVKHSHFISKAKDVLFCNVKFSIAKKGKKRRDLKFLRTEVRGDLGLKSPGLRNLGLKSSWLKSSFLLWG